MAVGSSLGSVFLGHCVLSRTESLPVVEKWEPLVSSGLKVLMLAPPNNFDLIIIYFTWFFVLLCFLPCFVE